MKKYYKIITDHSHFADEYKINDVTAIPSGTHFRANVPYDTEVTINASAPVIHFSESAFDTLMWQKILTRDKDIVAIYEIKPIGPVIKHICPDEFKLKQCGANEIQIGARVSADVLFERAKEEYKRKLQRTNNR